MNGPMQSGLAIHNVDLHYHAGQERQPGIRLEDYLEHAEVTGRKILGVTDHLGRYVDIHSKVPDPIYEQSVRGLLDFRQDIDSLKCRFPGMTILFGPELPPRGDLGRISREIVESSDFFIYEPPGVQETLTETTKGILGRIEQAGDFADTTGKPGFIAHPFRASVNYRLIKRDIESWILEIPVREPAEYSEKDLLEFFAFDVAEVGRSCLDRGMPLEINGETHRRIRSVNMPAILKMLWACYRIFRDMGVDLVPGSDQHAFSQKIGRGGVGVPCDAFDELGMTLDDIPFVHPFIQTTE